MREVLGRGFVLFNALQVFNCQFGLLSLLVDNLRQLVVLLLDFLDDFFLNALLLTDSGLHLRALLEGSLCMTEQLLELIYLKLTGLTECHTAATSTVQIEIAVIAESLVMDLTVGCQAVFVLAHGDLCLGVWLCHGLRRVIRRSRNCLRC